MKKTVLVLLFALMILSGCVFPQKAVKKDWSRLAEETGGKTYMQYDDDTTPDPTDVILKSARGAGTTRTDLSNIVQKAHGLANGMALVSSGALITDAMEDIIIAYAADAAPTTDDLIVTVNDPAGTPVMKKVTLGALAGLVYQAYNANLDTYGGIAPSANVQALLAAADYPAMKVLMGYYTSGDENTIVAAITETDLANLRDGITGIVIGAGDGVGYSAAVENVNYAGASHGSRHAPNGADPVDIWHWGGALTTNDSIPTVVNHYIYDCTGAADILTGSFVVGNMYKITLVGDTDFTLIGASSNTVGVIFTATGVGGGTTGTASIVISNFDGSFTDGDMILVLMNDDDVTLKCEDNATMECNANVNFTGSTTQIFPVIFAYRNSVWYSPNLVMGFSDPLTFNRGALQLPYSISGDATLTEAYVQQKSDEDGIAYHGGSTGEVQTEVFQSFLDQISIEIDPSEAYNQASTTRTTKLFYVGDRYPHGFTMTFWKVLYTQGDPTTELDADIMCDTTPDLNPAAGATVMDVLDTTAGASTADSGFDSATCANGSYIYIRYGADPVDAHVTIAFDMEGYAEED